MQKNEFKIRTQNHTSHLALHTSQKGITLIALIITIIVMLILVGVTINVSLNGGLFTKASEASKQMQVEAEKEELLSSVVAAIGYDGKVVLEDIELPTGWTGTNGTYTSPKGNNYTVDENGKITDAGEEKVYTFTLNQLKQGGYEDTDDSRIVFDGNYLWNNIIKEDLSDNEIYAIDNDGEKMFNIKSTDGEFVSYFDVVSYIQKGEPVPSTIQLVVMAVMDDEGKFLLGIFEVNAEGLPEEYIKDVWSEEEQETAIEEFLEEYGDVEFRFLDVSSLEFE